MPEQWKREQTERDRRHLLRKMTSQADNRMRTRTAKGQRADALDELADPCTPAAPVQAVDDEALQRAGVLT